MHPVDPFHALIEATEARLVALERAVDPSAAAAHAPTSPSEDPGLALLARARSNVVEVLRDARRRLEVNPELDELERLVRAARQSATAMAERLDERLLELELEQMQSTRLALHPSPLATTMSATSTDSRLLRVDAGPFSSAAALSLLERALREAAGVKDVYVWAFEERRATLELQVDPSSDPFAGLDAHLPFAVAVRSAGPGAAVLDVLGT